MKAACEQIAAYADGQLAAATRDAFREHFAGCEHCQRELLELAQLRALAEETAMAQPESSRPAPLADRTPSQASASSPAHRRRWLAAALVITSAGALAASIALAIGISRGQRSRTDATAALASLAPVERRAFEARLSIAPLDRWHPYGVPRAATRGQRALPLEMLATIERAGDRRELAAAYLLVGESDRAGSLLEQEHGGLPPDVASDRAAIELGRGRPAAALTLTEAALRVDPRHPQARWNRALALAALDLPLAAADVFDDVARAAEPGWADEARTRAEALRSQAEQRRAEWTDAWQEGTRLAAGASPAHLERLAAFGGLARLYFYDALRSAHGRERTLELLPLARVLDAQAGGDTLARWTARLARSDREPRATLETLGAWYRSGRAVAEPERFRQLAVATHDPWFAAMAAEVDAIARQHAGDLLGARRVVGPAIAECDAARLDYRCAKLEFLLAETAARLHWIPEARHVADAGWLRSRRLRDFQLEQRFISLEAEIARLAGDFTLARAYLDEVRLREPRDCATARYVHESRAEMAVTAHDPEAARRELGAAPTCADGRYTIVGAFTLAMLAGRGETPAEQRELVDTLAGLREREPAPGRRALFDFMAGRALLATDRAAGRAQLRRVIDDAQALPRADADAAKARMHALLALVADAAAHGDAADALALAAWGRGAPPPDRCALALAEADDVSFAHTIAVGRGADGAVFDQLAAAPSALARCGEVAVYALPPLEGAGELLPPFIAWRYAGASRAPESPRSEAQHTRLVVSDVLPPSSLAFEHLQSWPAGADPGDRLIHLTGAAATPARVLAALADADEIELHAHGLVDFALSDTSLVALSPDAAGEWALTGAAIRRLDLHRAPLVVLAACDSARTAPYQHASWSLPEAFLEAGASAVIAVADRVDDATAPAFFDAVRQRIRAGASPAVAVRDVRMQWLRDRRAEWVRAVVVFQ